MKLLRKTLSVVLCLTVLVGIMAGCGKNTDADTSSQTSSVNQVGNVVGLGGNIGAQFTLTAPVGTYVYSNTVDVSWNGLKSGETASLKIEKKNGDKYTTVLEKTGLTGNNFKSDDKLENGGVYRFTLKAVAKDGTERYALNCADGGAECTVLNVAKNPTVNAGMDFTINGKVSETVMNNYLSRAITYSYTGDNKVDSARAILNTGAKLICRALCDWYPNVSHEAKFPEYKAWMDSIHAYDPDIVFEACIFETCGPEMNNIKIPAYVFEAFGQKVENRCFNYKKMHFPDGYASAQWNETHGVPDITRLETQMFFYYRATIYIDLGIESLHLGQTGFMGKNDTNRESWTKVVHLIRDYAKKNARRNYVFINCHYSGSQSFVGTDGIMLADFNMWPLRLKGSGYGSNGEKKCVLNMDVDAPYKKGFKGTSPSGWKTEKYPYLVEFDNYGKPQPGSSTDIWGMDEISWIASQPDAYRRSFFTEVRKMVYDLNENGHVALPGSRTVAAYEGITWYNMNNKNYCKNGFSDEEAIIAAFKAYK